jgi:hypothetical protein
MYEDSVNAVTESVSLMTLHRMMGHIAPTTARRMVERGSVTGVRILSGDPVEFCESCIYAKATRKPIPRMREGERAKYFGDEIHTDLWGPSPIESFGGKRYYISFTDDKTRHTHLYLLAKKDEALDAYTKYQAWCATQYGVKIKILHSDCGGEYTGKVFSSHLQKAGTIAKLTVHDTPEQNGVAERLNRTIAE